MHESFNLKHKIRINYELSIRYRSGSAKTKCLDIKVEGVSPVIMVISMIWIQ